MVELAQGFCAFRLAQQRIVRLHAGVIRLIVERGVISGYDAGGIEGVDVAGAAGPRHFKASNGDNVRLAGIEFRDSVFIGAPLALCLLGSKAHVIQRALGVGSA